VALTYIFLISVSSDCILQINRNMMVTYQTCCSSLPELETAGIPEFSSFMLWLVQQRLLGAASAFHGYVSTLPGPGDMQSQALYMDEAKVSSLPARARSACESARSRFTAALDFIEHKMEESPPVIKLFQDSPALFDRDLNRWASAILLSRGFKVRNRLVLLPIIDLLNSQRSGATCDLIFDAAGAPLVRAIAHVPKGQEVFLNYGENKSDEELRAYYGYDHAQEEDEVEKEACAHKRLVKNAAG